jgi:hypothetical protein
MRSEVRAGRREGAVWLGRRRGVPSAAHAVSLPCAHAAERGREARRRLTLSSLRRLGGRGRGTRGAAERTRDGEHMRYMCVTLDEST